MISGAKNEEHDMSSHGPPPEARDRVTAATSRIPARRNLLERAKDAPDFGFGERFQLLLIQIEQGDRFVSLSPAGASLRQSRRLLCDFRCRLFHEKQIAAHEISSAKEERSGGGIPIGR